MKIETMSAAQWMMAIGALTPAIAAVAVGSFLLGRVVGRRRHG